MLLSEKSKSYLSCYPKSFLETFGFVGGVTPVKLAARRRPMKLVLEYGRNQTRCKAGHLTSEFSFTDSAGSKRCRRCLTIANRRYEERKRLGQFSAKRPRFDRPPLLRITRDGKHL